MDNLRHWYFLAKSTPFTVKDLCLNQRFSNIFSKNVTDFGAPAAIFAKLVKTYED